jgi:hypothetical protein
MKRRYIIMSMMLVASIGILSFSGLMAQGHHEASVKKNAPVNPDFSKEPVKCMADIYKCYHNWEIKRGLEMATKARAIIDKVYAQNPNSLITDPGLKLNKAFQVKSTLYTLTGMLYYRKALSATRKTGLKENAYILDKLKKGEEVTEKDLEKLVNKIESKSLKDNKKSALVLSIESFLEAIKSDFGNPAPHFQLASVYRVLGDSDSLKKAEECYFNAARLGVGEGDKKAKDRTLESLTSLNPESIYIDKIKALKVRSTHEENK